MTTYYAIGDVHGELNLLRQMMDLIYRREPGTIVFLGDYIDRGPDSKGVLDLVMSGPQKPGFTFVPLMGNHEDMCVHYYDLPGSSLGQSWLLENNGGQKTLDSFKKEGRIVPRHYIDWMRGLAIYHCSEHHIFVHAGLTPGKQPAECETECMLWIREEFLDSDYDWGKLVVHGHTIVRNGPDERANRINIDTGAVLPGGTLTCAVLSEDREVQFVQVHK